MSFSGKFALNRCRVSKVFFFGILLGVYFTSSGTSFAQAIGRLYASRPPAGSAFVRVVNASGTPLNVKVTSSSKAEVLATMTRLATNFVAIERTKNLLIYLNGQSLRTGLEANQGRFYTVVVAQQTQGYRTRMIVEDANPIDGLKSELRFYNLLQCNGDLSIDNGQKIFENVGSFESRLRAINPVRATLLASCLGAKNAALVLPMLKAGEHFSIFLSGSSENPVVSGQVDETESPEQLR